jgi:hypothetical protein
MKIVRISAFGALNQQSYDMFREHLLRETEKHHLTLKLICAGPYPNAEAVSAPGRPLRAEALQDEKKKQELLEAVAMDAHGVESDKADILCMPCMSMIGFHKGVEAALHREIFALAPALASAYLGADKVGVLHMRPAKKSIETIFGAKAVTPDEAQAAKLLAAEEEAKRIKSPAPVEAAMKEIAENWRGAGIREILFARADAPMAEKGEARIAGVNVRSHFGILAEAIARSCGT